jgi:hypothetical protein
MVALLSCLAAVLIINKETFYYVKVGCFILVAGGRPCMVFKGTRVCTRARGGSGSKCDKVVWNKYQSSTFVLFSVMGFIYPKKENCAYFVVLFW